MTLPSTTSLQSLSVPNRQSGWYHPNDMKRDQFLRKIPQLEMEMATDAYQFNRADSIPAIPFLARAATKNLPATNVTLNSVSFTRIGEHVELDTYDSISGRLSDNLETQARGVKLGILRQLSTQIIEGTATPNILGLRSLSASTTTGANNSAANGGFMSLQDLYKACYLNACSDDIIGGGGPDCAVLHPKALRELLGLLNAANGGSDSVWAFDEELESSVFRYLGLDWYISDAIPLNETKGAGTNLTSIYFVKLNGPTGLKLLYARDPNLAEVHPFGIHQYPIPVSQTENKRGVSIEAFYALYAPETACVSRLDGINPTQYAL